MEIRFTPVDSANRPEAMPLPWIAVLDAHLDALDRALILNAAKQGTCATLTNRGQRFLAEVRKAKP